MNRPDIDLLKQKYQLRETKRSPVLFFGRGLCIFIAIVATSGLIFSYHVTSTTDATSSENFSFFSTLKQLVTIENRKLKGESEDRVNVLLMGVGGEGHNGPQLTDTIIFTSFKPSDNSIGMMSLPRDMSVPIPNYGYRKVNHANAYGEMEEPGNGPRLASQVIGDILDEEIHYYVRVDFDGFAEFIDAIGGVDIYVDRSFTDPNYPSHGKEFAECGVESEEGEKLGSEEVQSDSFITDTQTQPETTVAPDYSCRFESLTFSEGWTHMDGDTALKFVRSRYGNNGEGSDFARSKRQQKVILAVKDKVLSVSTFLNPSRMSKMMDTLERNISTNLSVWEILRFTKALKELDATQITHHVIDASETSPLYATVLNGAYVLLPKNDDWSVLQQITDNIFLADEELNTHFAQASAEKPKFVRVEIQNGTNISGLAFRTSQLVDGQGFEVVKVSNAATRGYEHTVIYDLTNGQRAQELKTLRDFLQADVTLSATAWMISGDIVPKEIAFSSEDYQTLTTENNVDFLVILGESASELSMISP